MNALSDLSRVADAMATRLAIEPSVDVTGKVLEVIGTLVRVVGMEATLGELCELRSPSGALIQYAEVVGFTHNTALLSPFGTLSEINRNTCVVGLRRPLSVKVGNGLLGRVIDSFGEPIDGRGPLQYDALRPVLAAPPNPMSRRMIGAPLGTGVRIIDGLLTLGEGQRMGIFAPAGVGKSTLLGMLARGASCDVSVIALIGERGREVREFVELILGQHGMARSVVVCATSDRSSIERAKAAYAATAIAEYFRDQGKRVLLMMDSLTRFARAGREIGLAAGEPPARRGFPPSVFAELPRLLERAGMGERGSITALYTVLAEDDSSSDPVAEEVRGILDGHIILSREIAARNQYPAIDLLGSLSRVMPQVTTSKHVDAAGRLRQLLAKYREIETLLQLGEYQSGTDPVADEAITKSDRIRTYLNQATEEYSSPEVTLAALHELVQ